MKRTKTDVDDAKTWVKYEPSMCQGCFAGCCTLPVLVNTEDLFHMGFLKADEVNGPLAKVARDLLEKGVIQTYRPRSRTFILKQNGRDCVFLDKNRRCTIYERRPHVCREFPFNSERPGYCPQRLVKQVPA